MSDKEVKYICSVYDEPEKRFTMEGCWSSAVIGIDYCPFPGDVFKIHKGKNMHHRLFWSPKKCKDGVRRPLGIEECSYFWNEEKSEYDGECNQCGKCCIGCKFLKKETNEQ